MRRVGWGIVLGLVVVAGLAAAPVQGQTATPKPLLVLSGPDYLPYADGEHGLASSIVRSVFQRLNQPITIESMPWARGFATVAAGRADATYPYLFTEERARSVLYSRPLAAIQQLVFHARDRAFPFATARDLVGRVICAPIGYALPPSLQALVAAGESRREMPQRLDECATLVLAGRADVFVESDVIGAVAIRRAEATGAIIPAPQPLATATLHLIVGKTRPGAAELIARVNAAIAELEHEGVIEDLRNRYIGSGS